MYFDLYISQSFNLSFCSWSKIINAPYAFNNIYPSLKQNIFTFLIPIQWNKIYVLCFKYNFIWGKKYRFQHLKESKLNNVMKLSQQSAVRVTKTSALTEVWLKGKSFSSLHSKQSHYFRIWHFYYHNLRLSPLENFSPPSWRRKCPKPLSRPVSIWTHAVQAPDKRLIRLWIHCLRCQYDQRLSDVTFQRYAPQR